MPAPRAAPANVVTDGTQSNITAVGTLTSLSSTGNIEGANLLTAGVLSANGNVTGNYILGNGYYLTGVITSSTSISNGNSNVIVEANSNVTVSVAGNANVLVFTGTGANVNGYLYVTGNLDSANANLGNLAIANYFSGNAANLFGIPGANVTGTVANANYAAYAGDVVNATQSNITSVGTLTSLSVSGSANTGNINTGIISASGNLTTTNANLGNLAIANYFEGNAANLFGIPGANVTGTVANATHASTANTVVNAAQSNITSVGTLTNLSSLNLNFKVAHALGLSSSPRYDSLEILAYFSGKTIPVRIYKKGGTTLRTVTNLYTSTSPYKPASITSSDWRTETVDLSSYDTCKNVQFAFVFKPTQLTTIPSNNLFINTITVDGTDSPTALKTPTISVDSANNLDKNYTLTTTIPSTHNATSYQVLQGTTVIASGNLANNNATTITTARTNVTNGTYTHTANLSNGSQTKTSSPVTVNVSFNVTPILTGTLSVDSTSNKDPNYVLSFAIPQNHNATSYQILQGTTVIGSGNLANNNSITITLSRLGISNGTYTHTAKLLNSSKTPNNTTSNSVAVAVNYNPVISLAVPTVTADTLVNLDKNYIITFNTPSNHNATSYEIKEGSTIVKSSPLTNNNSFTTTLSVTNKANGTYSYTGVLKNGIYNSISLPINVIVNYNPSVPTSACTTTSITAIDRRRTNFTYSFNLSNSCSSTGYKVLFYNGNSANGFLASDSTLSQTQASKLIWQPTGGSVRNAGQSNGNITFTTSELNSSTFLRVASPLPSYSNRWYRVDVVCTSCTQTVKTKTAYFFVK